MAIALWKHNRDDSDKNAHHFSTFNAQVYFNNVEVCSFSAPEMKTVCDTLFLLLMKSGLYSCFSQHHR